MEKNGLSAFWRGCPVIERGEENNPGHVVGFSKGVHGEICIRIEFANGDRYNVLPDDLVVL